MAQQGVRVSSYASILPSLLDPLGFSGFSFIHPAELKAPNKAAETRKYLKETAATTLKRGEMCACVRVCAPVVTKITKYNFAGLTGQSWIALLVTYLLIYALSPASDPRVLTHMERLRTSRGHTSHRPAGGVRLLSGPARLSLRGEFPTDVTADVSSRNTGRFLGRGAKCW